jgi:aminoacylase
VRQLGLPAFGFSPMSKSPILLHEHNEFIHRDVFVNGIDVYVNLIPALANADVSMPPEDPAAKRAKTE